MNSEFELNIYLGGKQLTISPDGFQMLMLYNDDYYVVFADTTAEHISAMCVTDYIDECEVSKLCAQQ